MCFNWALRMCFCKWRPSSELFNTEIFFQKSHFTTILKSKRGEKKTPIKKKVFILSIFLSVPVSPLPLYLILSLNVSNTQWWLMKNNRTHKVERITTGNEFDSLSFFRIIHIRGKICLRLLNTSLVIVSSLTWPPFMLTSLGI